MLTELSLVEGQYLRDILDQPPALQSTLAGLVEDPKINHLAEQVRQGKHGTLVLTGMGSSFHALHPLQLKLIDYGLTAIMMETSELVHYATRLFDSKSLIVAVSQSGQSAEMVRLLETNAHKCPIIAITNTPGSPLATEADATILTQAGSEYSVSCKTYVTALMALTWLADVICARDLQTTRQELEQAAPAVESYLRHWRSHVQTLSLLLKGIHHLFLVGRGPSLAAVGTGALIIKESDHFPAEGLSSAGFRHGPFEMLGGESFVFVFSGDSATRNLNKRLLDDICQQQGRAEMVGENPDVPACALPDAPRCVQPILEILPVEMITLALAAQTGREPGRFELATKVTTTE